EGDVGEAGVIEGVEHRAEGRVETARAGIVVGHVLPGLRGIRERIRWLDVAALVGGCLRKRTVCFEIADIEEERLPAGFGRMLLDRLDGVLRDALGIYLLRGVDRL